MGDKIDRLMACGMTLTEAVTVIVEFDKTRSPEELKNYIRLKEAEKRASEYVGVF